MDLSKSLDIVKALADGTNPFTGEIFGFLRQSNISKKNVARLEKLTSSSNKEISELASIVLEVAKVKPYKKRRLKFLAREHRDLLKKLETTGLIFAHHW